MSDIKYTELSKAKTQAQRNIIISQYHKGGFTMAQQLEVDEGEVKTNVFLKSAFHIDDIDGLKNLRDAMNIAIEKVESGTANEPAWEE